MIKTKKDYLVPTDEQIETAGKEWKKALGINPYRLQANLDFQAGATWVRDMILKQDNNDTTEQSN